MNLTVPGVGSEAGPDYAIAYNNNLSTIDNHNHTTGYGTAIPVDGINVNANFPFNNHFLTGVAGLTLQTQLSTPANQNVYVSGVDLYYTDGVGNNVRITQSGAVAGSPGSIANLVSPASATYVAVSSKFVWQSNTNIAASMDFGTAILRNLSPNSTFGITLQAPAALGSNYSITLPALPASQKIMTLDNSGNLSAPYVVDNSTIEISSNTIQVKAAGITSTQLASSAVVEAKIATGAVTTTKIADEAITTPKLTDGAVTEPKIGNGAVTTTKVGDSAITTAKLTDTAVTRAKMATGPFAIGTGSLSAAGTLISQAYTGNGISGNEISICGKISVTASTGTITISCSNITNGIDTLTLNVNSTTGTYSFCLLGINSATGGQTISVVVSVGGTPTFTISGAMTIRDLY